MCITFNLSETIYQKLIMLYTFSSRHSVISERSKYNGNFVMDLNFKLESSFGEEHGKCIGKKYKL